MLLDFVHCLMFLKNITFQKLNLFPSSHNVMGAPTLLGLLKKTSLNQCLVSETLCVLKMLYNEQSPKNDSYQCNTPSSHPIATIKSNSFPSLCFAYIKGS
jgi:hypothetical protein